MEPTEPSDALPSRPSPTGAGTGAGAGSSWSRFAAALGKVPPVHYLGLFSGLLLFGLLTYFHQSVTWSHGTVWGGVVAMVISAGVVLVRTRASVEGRRRVLLLFEAWAPVLICCWVYENLHDITQLIRPDIVDPTLAVIDAKLMGTQASLWLQRFVNPVLTDYLSMVYCTYFYIPPLLAGYFYVRGHRERFREYQLIMLVAIYGGFMFYCLVPAVGPQFELANQYTVELKGAFYTWNNALLNDLKPLARDCFPSLHVGVSSIWMIYTFRHRKLLPAPRLTLSILSVITVSLWFSTVYLRYHWVIDVIAGWVWAVLADRLACWIHRRWQRTAPSAA